MKTHSVYSGLKASLFMAVAISATSAMAQFTGQFNWTPPTNTSPTVRIISPQEGSAFLPGDEVQICADADHFTNPVVSVEFFSGTTNLGVVTNTMRWSDDLYCLTVTNLTVGNYTLTAVATDSEGNKTTSAGVDISVVTNLPPKVHLVRPDGDDVFISPTDVKIVAAAFDPDGTVVSVEFFENTNNSLGIVPTPPTIYVTNRFGVFPIKEPYSVTWSNVPPGTYTLTAVATDNDGLNSTSAPVSIKVLPPPQPEVAIVKPQNGETFHNAPLNISIFAGERYFTNPIVNVQFFSGTTNIGMTTNSPYSGIIWSNVPQGAYTLTAVATDSKGINATSAPVNINVTTNTTPRWYWGH